jgi:hypothetical protein
MYVAMIRNTATQCVTQVHLPRAIDRHEAASAANRTADGLSARAGAFHRVLDIIEVFE